MRELIMRVGKRALAREAQIAMRTVNQAHDDPTAVSEDDWKRMAPAAQAILARVKVDEENQATAVAWMKQVVDQKGIFALDHELGDNPNYVKMMLRQRNVPKALVEKILEKIRSGD